MVVAAVACPWAVATRGISLQADSMACSLRQITTKTLSVWKTSGDWEVVPRRARSAPKALGQRPCSVAAAEDRIHGSLWYQAESERVVKILVPQVEQARRLLRKRGEKRKRKKLRNTPMRLGRIIYLIETWDPSSNDLIVLLKDSMPLVNPALRLPLPRRLLTPRSSLPSVINPSHHFTRPKRNPMKKKAAHHSAAIGRKFNYTPNTCAYGDIPRSTSNSRICGAFT